MPARTRLVLLVFATLALAGVFLAVLAKRVGDKTANDSAAVVEDVGSAGPKSPFKGALRPIARPRDFALHDQDGKLVRTKDLRGKVVLLGPMYTSCRDTCPLVAQQIRDALRDLPGPDDRQVAALAISVDPANDTPESANRFLDTRRVRGYLDFLIGSEAELRPVWKSYGFSEQTAEREHNSYVVLLDRRGRQRVGFPVDFLTPESLTHDLKVLLQD